VRYWSIEVLFVLYTNWSDCAVDHLFFADSGSSSDLTLLDGTVRAVLRSGAKSNLALVFWRTALAPVGSAKLFLLIFYFAIDKFEQLSHFV
jgi:hypothetical protein